MYKYMYTLIFYFVLPPEKAMLNRRSGGSGIGQKVAKNEPCSMIPWISARFRGKCRDPKNSASFFPRTFFES